MLTTSPVRKARPDEKADIFEVCKENWSENGQFGLSDGKLEKIISGIIDGGEGVIGVIRPASDIESIIMMKIGQFWYTDDWCLEEVMNFVRPAFRKSNNAKEMINFAKRCSDEIKIPLVIGVTSNHRTQAKIYLYERMLGEPWGAYFVHGLPNPPVPAGTNVRIPRAFRLWLEKGIEEDDWTMPREPWSLPYELKRDMLRQLRKWSGRT